MRFAIWFAVGAVIGLFIVSLCKAQESAPRISEFTTVEGPLEVGPPPDQYRPLAIQGEGCQCGVCQCERCDCALPRPEKLPVLSKRVAAARPPAAGTRPAVGACYGGRCYAPQRKRFLWWRW